jgi:EmrB/QacA subfamily drug resistance transporter
VTVALFAVPSIARQLHAGQSQLQWIGELYTLVLSMLLLPVGALADRYGRKRTLLTGLAVFASTCGWSAATHSATQLLVSRGLAGIGAALIFPSTLSTITSLLPPERRSRAVALWTTSAALGGFAGLFIGALLLQWFWWGSTFALLAAGGVVTLILAVLAVPETIESTIAPFDPSGAVLAAVAIGGLVFAVIQGPADGWTATGTLIGTVLGALAILAFITHERRTPHPMLDPSLFSDRSFTSGSVSIFVQSLVGGGFMFLVVQYLSYVLSYGPLQSGVALLPAAALLFPLAVVAGPLAQRVGRGIIGATGLVVLALCVAMLARIHLGDGYTWLAIGLLFYGAALGLAQPPATEAIVESLPAAKQGLASAVNDASRELALALGIAAFGSIFNAGYRAAVIAHHSSLSPAVARVVTNSPAAGLALATRDGQAGSTIASVVRHSFMKGWAEAMWAAAAVTLAGAIYLLIRTPRRQTRAAGPSSTPNEPSAPDAPSCLTPTSITSTV